VAKYRAGVSPSADIPALQGVDQLKGKTVMYMPIALTVPFFQAAIHGLTDSLGTAGVTLQTCDAKANPSSAAACLDQAVKQHVAAVVTDSVPQAFAAQAFAALQAAHIPVVTVDNGEGTASATQAYVGGAASIQAAKLSADWITADSQGKADVLLLEIVDSPASKSYVEEGALPEFKTQCPGCKVTVVKSTTSDLQNVPSLISTALVRDPGIGYVYAEFDVDVPAVVQGLQTSSGGSKVKVVGTTGVLTSLQLIASGQHQVADIAQDGYEEGWAAADQAFRLMLGQPARTGVNGSLRVFDKTNIGSLQLTAANAASGAFFGDGSYRDEYLTAWGTK
jgi:ribose transport system substrate-binding protein